MTAPNFFASCTMRVASANDHIRDLETRIGDFFGADPYVYVVDPDPDGVSVAHKIKLAQALPDVIQTTAGDAIEDLRSALDQCGYAAALADKKDRPKKTAFPFGHTADDVDNALKGWGKDLP